MESLVKKNRKIFTNEANCNIAHNLGILLMNSNCFAIFIFLQHSRYVSSDFYYMGHPTGLMKVDLFTFNPDKNKNFLEKKKPLETMEPDGTQHFQSIQQNLSTLKISLK